MEGIIGPTERAFIDAIICRPDDDAPRLVFADWLDEHGHDVRAEFIRVQCKLAEHSRSDTLTRRDVTHIMRHQLALWQTPVILHELPEADVVDLPPIVIDAGELLGGDPGCIVRRGFIDEIRDWTAEFMRDGRRIAATQPVRRVSLLDKEPAHMTIGSRGLPMRRWVGSDAGLETLERMELPNSVYRLLQGGHVTRGGFIRSYQTLEESDAAVSAACVAWLRRTS